MSAHGQCVGPCTRLPPTWGHSNPCEGVDPPVQCLWPACGPRFCVYNVSLHVSCPPPLSFCVFIMSLSSFCLCPRTVNLSTRVPARAQLSLCVPPVWKWVGVFTQVLAVGANGSGGQGQQSELSNSSSQNSAQGYGPKYNATSAKCSRKAAICQGWWGRKQSPRHSRTSEVRSMLPQVPPTSSQPTHLQQPSSNQRASNERTPVCTHRKQRARPGLRPPTSFPAPYHRAASERK